MAGSKTPDADFAPLPDFSQGSETHLSEQQSLDFEPGSALEAEGTGSRPPGEQLAFINPGEIVGERYRVQSLIGHGGMGMVYKVEQIYLRRELALKVLNTRTATDVSVRRFQHEARAAFGIDHPNLIAVHDFGLLNDKVPFLVMEYVRGTSLADRIRNGGTLSVEEAVPIFLRICFGLGYAHDRGVIHRDIKPSNIMLVENLKPEDDGSVKIVDFGIAKFTQFEKGDIQALTRTGEVFGSPLYMSPEQCTGSPVDQRSDIYSLGCVFFEALTGTTPFVGANALSTMMQHMGEEAPTMHEASMGKSFPPLLEQIIAKMLAKKASERYQSLNHVTGDLAALERTLGDPDALANTVLMEAVKKRPEPRRSETDRAGRPALYFVMALLVVLSATLSSVITSQFDRQKLEKTPEKTLAIKPEKKAKKEKKIDEQEIKVAHREAARQFLRFLEMKNGRPEVSAKSIAVKLRQPGDTRKLTLKYLNISDASLQAISRTKWIDNIDLLGCAVNNSKLIDFANLPNLHHLTLSLTNLDDVGAAGIAKCSNIADLCVSWTNVTDKAIPYFTAMSSLVRLEISGVPLTPVSMRFLAEKQNLQQLVMVHATGIDDESFAPMVNSHLTFLNIEGCNVGNRAAFYLSQMKKLQCISIGSTRITAAGVEQLLKNKRIAVFMYVPSKGLQESDIERLSKQYPRCQFKNKLQRGDLVL